MECLRMVRTTRLLKLLGLLQCVLAIIVTSIGIAVVVKFRKVHHEKNSPYETAIDYIDNPWTTTYAAGVWIGLVLLLAGVFGSSADIKPEKSKYVYASLLFNILVVIFAIILIPFTAHGLDWYRTCQYTYYMSNGKIGTRDCSAQDKDVGTGLYIVFLLCLILVLPVTIGFIVFLVISNKVLFEGCFTGGWYRQFVYGMKGKSNLTSKMKTTNTHEFDKVFDDTNSIKVNSPIKEEGKDKPVFVEMNGDSSKRKNTYTKNERNHTYTKHERNHEQRLSNEERKSDRKNSISKNDEEHHRGRSKNKTSNERHRSLSHKEKTRNDQDRQKNYEKRERTRNNSERDINNSDHERSEYDKDRQRSSKKKRRSSHHNSDHKDIERNHNRRHSDEYSTDNYSSSVYL